MGISLGLVGLGAFGKAFADLFKKHPMVSRVGLCDREPERVARFADLDTWKDKFNPKDVYASLDDICAADFDALVIITQPWLHAAQCIQAMNAGKHVYSAVPIVSLPDTGEVLDWCDKLVTTAAKTGMHYMLGETTYYRPQAMYCRRRAAAGDFGQFTYSEGEYFHGFDSPGCDLREVGKHRAASAAGQEGIKLRAAYHQRGHRDAPMQYPTHSTGGPICVTGAHAKKVCCWGTKAATDDSFFKNYAFSNQTALFQMSDGSTMRICEHRECSVDREIFRIYGTKGSFENDQWVSHQGRESLTDETMRDALPDEVAAAWRNTATDSVEYGGHGGSHAYLVHEFVDAVAHNRVPAINAWEAARYMAAGAVAHESSLKDGEILDVPDWGDAPC